MKSRTMVAFMAGALFTAALHAESGARHNTTLTEHIEDAVAYRSGGVGDDEIALMKAETARYPLEILFGERQEDGKAAYVAAQNVSLSDSSGKTILELATAGPILLIRVKDGDYLLKASNRDIAKEQKLRVANSGHQRIVLQW